MPICFCKNSKSYTFILNIVELCTPVDVYVQVFVKESSNIHVEKRLSILSRSFLPIRLLFYSKNITRESALPSELPRGSTASPTAPRDLYRRYTLDS